MINLRQLEIIFKALANRRRLAILEFLKKQGEANVGEIAKAIKLSFHSTSKHLSILEKADILYKEQRNREVYYKIENNTHRLVKPLLFEF